jgi:hypothetical protein
MPLQFFDDIADETHDARLTAGDEIAKSFCRHEILLAMEAGIANHVLSLEKNRWFAALIFWRGGFRFESLDKNKPPSNKDERTRFVAVLEIPPVVSAETAVRVQIVKDSKGIK